MRSVSQLATRDFVSVQETAVAYGKFGFKVFPLHWMMPDGRCSCRNPECDGNSRAKHPLHLGWKEEATTDEATIRRLWTKTPLANVGIKTGSGLVVVDVDPREDGDDTLADLEAQYGKLPDTALVLTGGGGTHRYFLGDCPSYRLRGLHVQSDDHFVVAPPSGHYSGGNYTWEASSVLGDVPLAPLPTWVQDLDKGKRGQENGTTAGRCDPARVLSGVKEGERDDVLWKYAKDMQRRGLPKVEALALIEVAARADDPPFSLAVAREKVEREYGPDTDAEMTKPLVLRSIREFRKEGVKPREDVIAGALPRGGLLQILGAPKVGKSLLGLNLAVALARGTPFLGWPTLQGPVIVLNGEGGAELPFERLGRMAPDEGPELDRIFLWTPEPGGLRFTLDDPVHRAMLAHECRKLGVVSIIVDPLVSFHDADENSTAAMKSLVMGLLSLALETQAGVVVLHHTRKPSAASRVGAPEEARGSSVLHGAVDGSLVLNRRSDSLIVTPQLRWVPSPQPMSLSLDEESLTFTVDGEANFGGRKLDPNRVLAIFKESDCPLGYGELETRTTFKTRTLRVAVSRLVSDGLVEECHVGGKKAWRAVAEEAIVPF
jgi:hypothetical protein